MADLMCPAPWRTIKAAHDAEFARWELINDSRCGQIDIWRDGKIWKSYDLETIDEVTAIFMPLRDSACWRAALRALAEMEPTKSMKDASLFAGNEKWPLYADEQARRYILAAAAGGEKQ